MSPVQILLVEYTNVSYSVINTLLSKLELKFCWVAGCLNIALKV